VSLREVGAWGYVRGAAGVTSGVMFALILASSPASAVDSGRSQLLRDARRSFQEGSLQAPPSGPAVLPAAQPAGLVGSASCLSILGGLAAGVAVAWASRARRDGSNR
jgi:hypothetical protein